MKNGQREYFFQRLRKQTSVHFEPMCIAYVLDAVVMTLRLSLSCPHSTVLAWFAATGHCKRDFSRCGFAKDATELFLSEHAQCVSKSLVSESLSARKDLGMNFDLATKLLNVNTGLRYLRFFPLFCPNFTLKRNLKCRKLRMIKTSK